MRESAQLQPPPPPPHDGWCDTAANGDTVQLWHGNAWWPMKVLGWKGSLLSVRSDAYGTIEGTKHKEVKMLRPNWEWHPKTGMHSYKLGGTRLQAATVQLEAGGTAHVVGLDATAQRTYGGCERKLMEQCDDGRWRLRGRGDGQILVVAAAQLQPTSAAPEPGATRNAASVAKEQVRGWLNMTKAEAVAIARSLEERAEELRAALQPRESVPIETAAWREARRNFADVSELRAALQAMDKGKTGQSMAVEQLINVDDHILEPWLEVTGMFFAGEVVDELKLGTVSPLPKSLGAFRPVTLLEPIYKCCMGAMASRLLHALHEFGLLDGAQYGFVKDGSCVEPLTIMARIFERGRGEKGEEIHVAFLDATSAFDSVPHTALDAALKRLGAPPDFVTWLRKVLSGHKRKAATAYEVDGDNKAVQLDGGTPQGDPASPAIWVIVMDYALAVMRAKGPKAYDVRMGGEALRVCAFVDDLAAMSHTGDGADARGGDGCHRRALQRAKELLPVVGGGGTQGGTRTDGRAARTVGGGRTRRRRKVAPDAADECATRGRRRR